MDAIDAVVDAFVWPLRLLGIAQPAEGELNHVPLLSIPHNAIVNHLIPALSVKEKTRLSCTCKVLWQLVASTVTQLKLGQTAGSLCVAAKSPRLREVVLLPSATGPVIMLQFTNVTRIQLTVRGWHDIGFGAPQLLLHLSTALPKIQEVTLLDKSHEDMYEPLASTPTGAVAQAAAHAASNLFHAAVGMTTGSDGEGATCDGCGYDTELPDLTCVLMSLLALYPGLKKLEVYTKLLSTAEVAALSRLPQLTSLTLNSEDGVVPGALCSLSQLKTLQELRLGDVDGNNPSDINTVCDLVSRLTSLHMGYCPRLQPPVLRKVQQVHMAVNRYLEEEKAKAEQEQRRSEYQAAGIVGKAARVAASAASSAASAVLPSFLAGHSNDSSKHDNAPAGSASSSSSIAPHLRESEQMLIDSGIPADMFNKGTAGSTALSAAAAAAPKPEGSVSLQQQEHEKRRQQGRDDQVSRPEVVAEAARNAIEDLDDVDLPAAAVYSDVAKDKPITSAYFIDHSKTGKGISNSPGPTFRLVTELSVNIDAEEGEEILYEMSQLSLLESLLVDSTDEFTFDPGFQPFGHTTNLRKLAITMPMSLANTQSLQRCNQLRELLLCALPRDNLGKGSLQQVTRLELLDIAPSPPNPDLLQAFPRITHLIIRKGADDSTLKMIGHHMTTLVHLELYQLPAGYSQGGLRGIGHLSSLRSLVLELASPGTTLGDRVTRQYHTHNPLLVPFTLVGEIGSELSAAAGSMGVPLLGTNPILAFAAPPEWGIINRIGFQPSSHANNWFPSLRYLSLQGYVAAADRDLHALAHLTKLEELSMHLQRPRGIAGQVTLRGLWNLVEMSPTLAMINLTGYMSTQLLVPGRVPGIGY